MLVAAEKSNWHIKMFNIALNLSLVNSENITVFETSMMYYINA